jgi:hypothetical protein
LESLEGLSGMPNLEELYLGNIVTVEEEEPAEGAVVKPESKNKITSLKGLHTLPKLSKLDLSGNLIKAFDEVPALEALKELNLDFN